MLFLVGGVNLIATKQLKIQLKNGQMDNLLRDIYLDDNKMEYQRARYWNAIETFEKVFGVSEVTIYSAPGRTEIGGNHTDHQLGEVLAAAVNLDAIAIVRPVGDPVVQVVSEGYDMITIGLDALSYVETEKQTTCSLIKGILQGFCNRGYVIGGFQAYITSDVLIGAGLSSSASFEVLIGTILSGLYNDGEISPIDIAKIGQYAENVYFGKPCGLMDQMACAVGNLVHIDFANQEEPFVEEVHCDLERFGYCLCITDTKGSHADLTADYAAIPGEMKQVATLFGEEVLRNITLEQLIGSCEEIRCNIHDRAFLRAMHFVMENERVREQVLALKKENFESFLIKVKESGASSFQYLQNIYSSQNINHQNISVALAVSDALLGGRGVCRVHGGGFAGTIQAYVPNDLVICYKKTLEDIFGEAACSILQIRKYGGMRVI